MSGLRVGVFCGSFNPPHIGHLVMAQCALTLTDLDEVWLMPSPRSPFKSPQGLASPQHRLRMCLLATRHDDRLRACDVEMTLPQPSYTVHTFDRLREMRPGVTFDLVMGADNVAALPEWREARRLCQGLRIVVCQRPDNDCDPTVIAALGAEPLVLDTPLIDVSSTQIRQWVAQGRSVRHFVPEGVAEYIQEARLYGAAGKTSEDEIP